ncbi:2'-5' RNA ligase family protein [Nakamurella sp. A5-74]|uniref:2'-5' RNA ligase family protein n=1 Tax=Nakamurella sp. A5-74 TaxID=3158264 RepID=A0AAU8DM82_9ACTN
MSLVGAIFPDADLTEVEQFRVQWDPLADSVAAHITIVFPFSEVNDLEALRTLSMEPFPVRFGTPSLWEGEYLFLTADVGDEHIVDLHRRSYGALQLPLPADFVPHMTIGRRPAGSEAKHMLARATGLVVEGWARSMTIYRRHLDGRRTFECTVGDGPSSAAGLRDRGLPSG